MSEVEIEPTDDEVGSIEGSEASSGDSSESDGEPIEDAAVSPLALLEADRDKLRDQLLRTAADFDNYRKRSRKDVEQSERRGRESILREVLPVIDNLRRAVEAAQVTQDVVAVREGILMVLRLFDDTASRIDLTKLESVGTRFDPNLHDAFQQLETDEHAPGTIVRESQAGSMLGDKLLRPAMVVVARRPPEPPLTIIEGEGDDNE